MLTNASKHFAGLVAVVVVSFFVYLAGDVDIGGVGDAEEAQDSLYGAIFTWRAGDLFGGLLFFFVAMAAVWLLAAVLITRDRPGAPVAEPVEVPVAAPSPWPLAAALGMGLVAVGLVVDTLLTVAGIVVMAMAALEWVTSAWSDRHSTDLARNEGLRARMMVPFEVPFFAVALIAVPVFLFSRVLLASTKDGATIVAAVLSIVILGAFFVLYARPGLGRGLLGGASALAAVGLLAAGISAIAIGPRDFEVHVGEGHGPDDDFEQVSADADDDGTVADEDPLSDDLEEGDAELVVEPGEGIVATEDSDDGDDDDGLGADPDVADDLPDDDAGDELSDDDEAVVP